MKITIESTPNIVEVDGRRARIWKGQSEAGVPVLCYIWTISPQTRDEAVNQLFAEELVEIKTPHAITPIKVTP